MERELQKILEELQKEFGKFNKVLGSTNKTIIKRTKSEKEESEAKKRAKLTMYDYIKAQQAGKELTVEFAEELEEATMELLASAAQRLCQRGPEVMPTNIAQKRGRQTSP